MRVMTSDSGSVLADAGRETGPLIKKLTLEFVQNTRGEGVSFGETRRERERLPLQPQMVLGLGLQVWLLHHGKVLEL